MLGDHIKTTARALRPVLLAEKPQLIYVPHAAEWHPDHQAALPVLRLALKTWRGAVPELRAYEVWTPLAAHDHTEDISHVMARKLKALRAHRSQLREFNYERAVCGLNSFRGELAAKCRYAEVFQSVTLEAGR
jgi:LmbE family N-acetylglucosaminyl deacetylase